MKYLSKEKVISLIQGDVFFRDAKVLDYHYFPEAYKCFCISYLAYFASGQGVVHRYLSEYEFLSYINSLINESRGYDVQVTLCGYIVGYEIEKNITRSRRGRR